MHVGKLIKDVFDRQPKGCTAAWLASRLNCDRRNVYKIFSRPYIDTDMLMRVSKALDHDFFLDLSESMKTERQTDPQELA